MANGFNMSAFMCALFTLLLCALYPSRLPLKRVHDYGISQQDPQTAFRKVEWDQKQKDLMEVNNEIPQFDCSVKFSTEW